MATVSVARKVLPGGHLHFQCAPISPSTIQLWTYYLQLVTIEGAFKNL